MNFTYSEDQLLFQESVRDFLINEVSPEKIRSLWESETGRCDTLWGQLTELGLTGLTVPESYGGLGMNELDFVLLAQEAGFVALPEPLVHIALVSVPTLVKYASDALKAEWLPKIASGEAKVVVGLEQNLVVEDAHVADLLVLEKGGSVYAVTADQVELSFNESVDRSRRLYQVAFDEQSAELIAEGQQANDLVNDALNRGALGSAAQALGLSQRMVEMSVQYTGERKQFGVAIGTFQAVKHHMANIAVKVEYAKAPLARAAYAIAKDLPVQNEAVSHAKFAACEAGQLAAKNCVQVHGAMGYTWEVDLHIFMKKAWALANSWGDAAFHKARIADVVFADKASIGAGNTF